MRFAFSEKIRKPVTLITIYLKKNGAIMSSYFVLSKRAVAFAEQDRKFRR